MRDPNPEKPIPDPTFPMKLSGTVQISKPRDAVWAALNNPDVLARIIPACEKLERLGDDEYAVAQNLSIGAVKGTYTGKVLLRDKKPPESLRLEIAGKGPSAFLRGAAKVSLEEKGGATDLAYDADVQIGGLLASLGSRLLEPVAKSLIAQFFQSLEKQI